MAGKRIRNAYKAFESDKLHSIEDAIAIVCREGLAKFDSTVELVLPLNVDPKYTDQMVRGVTSLPNGTGVDVRVLVIAAQAKHKAAKDAGADQVSDEEIVEEILKGVINFDVCIATPEMMPKLSKAARVLGPKGLMPNPKLGTVTEDVAEAVKLAKAGQVEYRLDKAGIVHVRVGKVSFGANKLIENIVALVSAVRKARPSGAKGVFMSKAYVCSTMGPSVKVDLPTIVDKIAA